MCGFIAQLVEHRTSIAEVTSSNPVEALIFQASFFQLLKLEIYCYDHSSLSQFFVFKVSKRSRMFVLLVKSKVFSV